jgi:2-C-methyl-D-erythritol 2,4-cyclodiphosphate synthase
MFPDTDATNRGLDSAQMLRTARDDVKAVGLKICNLDCIVFAKRPKILTHKQKIRERLADILDVEPERIGLQAKTGNLVGPVGREEAIEAQCVVLLQPIGEAKK